VISTLRGTVTGVMPGGAVVEVGGVGFFVHVPVRTLRQLRPGEDTQLFTALIVREDDMSLYGFAVEDDRHVFELLRSVNGVGPKSALGVLSDLSASDVAHAVASEDDKAFTAVSGIGPKTGKLIVVTLAGKMGHLASTDAPVTGPGDSVLPAAARHDIVTALIGLGWSEKVASAAVDEVVAGIDGDLPPVTELIRRTLAQLGPKRVAGESR